MKHNNQFTTVLSIIGTIKYSSLDIGRGLSKILIHAQFQRINIRAQISQSIQLGNVEQEKNSSKQAFNIKETNSLMCRQKKPHRPKITDHIKIKTNITTKPPIIPKQKKFNLKDPKFREKGLKKKNINNI